MSIKELYNLSGKFLTDEQFEELEESPEVVQLDNNGNSGEYCGATWWTATLSNGDEIDFYTSH